MASGLRVVVAGIVAALVMGAAGCASSIVDGDLTDDWGGFSEPTQMRPEVGVCHNSDHQSTVRLGIYYQPRECTEPHHIETAYVGSFTGEPAERETPPSPGTAVWRQAYAECDREVADYLGSDFRHGRLRLGVGVPTDPAWSAGARWFRCDLTEQRINYRAPIWPESLRGALATGPSALTLDCFTVTATADGEVEEKSAVECSEPHQAQFAGVWHSDMRSYPTSQAAQLRVHRGCAEVVRDYLDGADHQFGTMFDYILEEDWDNGDRGFRCYLWSGQDLTEVLGSRS